MKLNTNPLKGKYPITVRIAGLCGILSLVLIFLVISTALVDQGVTIVFRGPIKVDSMIFVFRNLLFPNNHINFFISFWEMEFLLSTA